jgi:hypothetical protein
MTDNLPNYDAIEPPEDVPKPEYGTHERRADVWRTIKAAGSPARVNKAALAREYDCSRKTVYRDLERLREWADETLGEDAKLTSRAVFETVVDELLATDDWRAKKAALDAVMDWNEWLADLGEQHREPEKVEADVRERRAEVQYQVVREAGDGDALPTTEDGDGVDFEALGFAEGPVGVDVDAVENAGGAADE